MRRNQTLSQRAQTSVIAPRSWVSDGSSQRPARGWRFGTKTTNANSAAAQIAANGGDFDPQEPRTIEEQFEREGQAVARCVEELERLGVLVKDLDRGLVDFPALRGDEEVLLCWEVGEDEIAYWHGVDEGFAG